MKASFFCTNTYLSAEPFRYPGWPTPPGLYRPEIGLKSVEVALEQAKLADDLGFDWVSCSEHHYTPLLQTPNAMVRRHFIGKRCTARFPSVLSLKFATYVLAKS